MFRIELFALWSRDYLASLARVLASAMGSDRRATRRALEALDARQPLVVTARSLGEANYLAQVFMKLGCYTSVTQLERISDESQIRDFDRMLKEELKEWYVFSEAETGRITHLIEKRTLARLKIESDAVDAWLSRQVRDRGGTEIRQPAFEALSETIAAIRPVVQAWELEQKRLRKQASEMQLESDESE